jgi:hypothetical protein
MAIGIPRLTGRRRSFSGPNDIVTFNSSNITDVSYSANSLAYGIVFNPLATSYTLTVSHGYILMLAFKGLRTIPL